MVSESETTDLTPDYVSLAERVERLVAPCREADALIYVLCNEIPVRLKLHGDETMWAGGATVFWRGGTVTQGPVFRRGDGTYPYYTASFDAAMTLVPVGIWYCLSGPHSELGGLHRGGPQRFDMTVGLGDCRADGKAPTAFNAITAAALRFRALVSAR